MEYAAVWGTLAEVVAEVPRIADDVPVGRISTLLEAAGRAEGNPERLAENAGVAFIGCYVLGMGFVLDPAEAQKWIAADATNVDVLFPYLNGEDLNSRPDASASRWVIDFNDWPEARARQYPIPYARAESEVRHERQRRNSEGEFVLRQPLPTRWWQYADKRPALRRAIADLDEVLVIAQVSKTLMPCRVATSQVFDAKLVVFAADGKAFQAAMSSSVHQAWAVQYGTTMRTDATYTPSTVFDTFPQPQFTARLERVGRTLDRERREIMLRRGLGLTKLYNLVNSPNIADAADADIARMRAIHVDLDQAVMDAYGWSDIPLQHGFHTYRHVGRWTVGPAARVEILDRLLEENHKRAAVEASGETRKSGQVRVPESQAALFDEGNPA